MGGILVFREFMPMSQKLTVGVGVCSCEKCGFGEEK